MTYAPTVDGAPSRALVPTPSYAPPAPAPAGFAPRGPDILHGGFDQTWLANCLRRRWLMASLMGLLVGAATTAALLWAFPTMCKVTAYLQVKSGTEGQLIETGATKLSPMEIERQAQNHLALLTSPMVLSATLQDQSIADLDAVRNQGDEALLWLTQELKVSFPGDGEILEVRYDGEEDADQMVKVINAVVKAYQDNVLLKERLQLEATQSDLTAVLQRTKEDLQNKLTTLKSKLENLGLSSDEIEIPRLQNEVRSLEQQIVEVNKQLIDLEVMRQLAWQNSKAPSAVQLAIAEAMEKDPTMAMYKQQLVELQAALRQRLASSKNPQDAMARRLEGQIQQINAEMENYKLTTEKQLRDEIAKMPDDNLRAVLLEYNIRNSLLKKTLEDLQAKLETANDKLDNFGTKDPTVEMLQQDIMNLQEVTANLEQKVLSWQVVRDTINRPGAQPSGLEKVSVIQDAQALPAVNTIERLSIAGVGGIAAMGLTCYGIALMEFRKRRLNSPGDVDDGLGVRVLGVLPSATLKAIAGNSLVATQVAESIDNVRATLMHDSTSAPRQVVLVTSSGSQEGTTVVASSLALSLARAGRPTLLVDADLRSPSMHKLFGMPMEEGLSEVLRSEIDLADAIRPTNNEGLYLLTAGICSHDAVYALATDQPQAIFDKLRDQFDFVVVDCPPVLGISDTLSLGQYADGAILTVLRDHSEIRKVHKAVELLRSMGVRVIGSVVNGVPLKADRRVVRLHQAAAARPVPQLPGKTEA